MASTVGEIEVDINETCRGVVIGTVKLTGVRRFDLRVSLCKMLLHLAAWVAPVGIDIEDSRGVAPEDSRD